MFSRLSAHRLKLAPKKCHFLQRSVKFLGHVIDESGVSTNPEKVQAIAAMTEKALMGDDGATPSPKKIKSFLGMVIVTPLYTPTGFAVAVQQLLGGEWA